MSRPRLLRPPAVTGTVLALALLAACGGPPSTPRTTSTTQPTPTQEATVAVTQEGAPYPADMDHLEDILSIGKGHQLPDDAQALSVDPATNFAKSYPGGWGYIIAFTATDQAIRDYVTTYTGYSGKSIEIFAQSRPDDTRLEDVDLSTITNPWNTGFDDTTLLLERPLGRGWLIIRGGCR
ncbi:hypothetical protein [Actinomyces gerencseriae]